MGKTLVLAEKPSVARDLARVLGCHGKGNGCLTGGQYIVTWALGHLVTLADPEAYNDKYKQWRMEDLPMLPEKMKLVVISQSSAQFRAVQSLMKRSDVTDLIIATDAGREGELVARWIMEKAGWRGSTRRLWISSQTDQAIRQGFQNLRPARQYDSLYRSAVARSEADWLVGLNVTRALTCKYNAQLSAGRVQTPTLALIVAREEELKRFVPQDFWTVQVKAGGFHATWRGKTGQSRLTDKAKADALAAAAKGQTGRLTEVNRMRKYQQPPAAYDLTELQRDANKKFAYSAKETLRIMQRLYETHKVLTYPRTDSRYITDDVVGTLMDRLRAVATAQYKELAYAVMRKKPLSTKYIVNNNKVSDHHAIIPTEEPPDLFSMTGEERNIYDLVVRRFLAVLSPACEYEEVKLTLQVGKERFYAKGKIMLEPGWRAMYDRSIQQDDEEEEEPDQTLPEKIRQGEALAITSAATINGKTKPPARYTEDVQYKGGFKKTPPNTDATGSFVAK